MKKAITTLVLIISIFLAVLIIVISTNGIETNRFNNFISQKINQSNNNINLELNSIVFKLDIKEMSLFLDTPKPKINYRNTAIPAEKIKVYIDFISLIKSNPKIKKIKLVLEEIDINQLKNLSTAIKPSNFKSLIDNKIKQGKLISELEFFFDKDNLVENFIAKGSVSNFKTEIIKNLNFDKANFNFFADKTDILIKNIFGELDNIKITDGDLKIMLSPEISLESNFKTNFKYNNNSFINLSNLIKEFTYADDITSLKGDFNNYLSINFDKTYKVTNYKYENNGKILEANLNFKKPFHNILSQEKINQLSIINSEITTSFSPKKSKTTILGKYSLNNGDFLAFDLKNFIDQDLLNLDINFEYSKKFIFEFINYLKPENLIANFSFNLEKRKDAINVKEARLKEKNNLIIVKDLNLIKNKFLSLKKILVNTSSNGKINNDFSITFDNGIMIKGSKFDASNIPKIINQKRDQSIFSNINQNIEIDFKNIIAPLSENLKNFKLIGKIEKGKFVKITSKGDFGANNFLDISMKSDKKNKKKYLEIYSDLTRPLLTEYSFFKGLTGGKLLYSSIIDKDSSSSKLKIEDFKVINAPGMVKLLSLADLGGLADLAEGDGLSFDILEINIEKTHGLTKLHEILALGPSVSVLMEGYLEDNGSTSIRGTLVPAKNLNKIISKIPLIGDIIIPKEVGEGLFGISFKMKGPSGKIKTTINPIRTLTPRFIQKIIDKKKNSK